MKLNGWQRLWILIGVIYLVPVIFLLFVFIPKKNQIYKAWYLELSSADVIVEKIDTSKKIDYKNQINLTEKRLTKTVNLIRERAEKPTNEVQHSSLNKPSKNPLDEIDWDKVFYDEYLRMINIKAKYEEKLHVILKEQIFYVLIFVGGLWLLPLAFLYILCVLVGWVYKGFKQKEKQ